MTQGTFDLGSVRLERNLLLFLQIAKEVMVPKPFNFRLPADDAIYCWTSTGIMLCSFCTAYYPHAKRTKLVAASESSHGKYCMELSQKKEYLAG